MNFGLSESDIAYIIGVIRSVEEIDKAVIFGSRAKGNYKPGSDIDIAIYGEKITFDTLATLHSMLEERGPLPYFFDVVNYSQLKHRELKEHIDRVGKIIFQRESSKGDH
ncbi:Predicted nucleotidyltransferase [Geosporobacter subterraneus DSM 17957]|uniref:Predicted nucleotidyltransferase n=1 Tax=Geosporobacter subterraneus DSM 17957 TaxID=1121919 RepID=A0A1M6MUA7_9FIRM|nr:nucleotidyltransferase domain-containing protein [Geosporobacter subterraneus]SHJ86996.1 Predicted nucleotidyltransferase [Geosporobacter subterraneus DSM 17957]